MLASCLLYGCLLPGTESMKFMLVSPPSSALVWILHVTIHSVRAGTSLLHSHCISRARTGLHVVCAQQTCGCLFVSFWCVWGAGGGLGVAARNGWTAAGSRLHKPTAQSRSGPWGSAPPLRARARPGGTPPDCLLGSAQGLAHNSGRGS